MTTITDEMKRNAALRWCNYERPGGCNEACGTCIYRAGQILQAAISNPSRNAVIEECAERIQNYLNGIAKEPSSLADFFNTLGGNVSNAIRALKSPANPSANADAGGAVIPLTKTVIDYIARYGSRCRDCADEAGVCPNSGLPCGGAEKAIKHVLSAYNYGIENGFLPAPIPQLPDGWVMVPREPTREMLDAAWTTIEECKGDATDTIIYRAMLAAAPKPQVPGGE